MSVTNLVRLPSVSNVAAGNTATVECPVGAYSYDKIHIEHDVGGVEKIELIECLINGKVFQTYESASWLRKLNAYRGIAQQNNIITLHFDLPHLGLLNDIKGFGIGTANITNFHIRLTLKSDATNPSLKATAQVSALKPLGLISILRRFPVSTSVAGVVDIDNIPRGARIMAIHLAKSDITHVEVRINNTTYYEASDTLNALQLKQTIPNPREPMAGVYSLDFASQGTPAGALVTQGLDDLRVKATVGTAGSMQMNIEYFGVLGSA